MFGETVRDIASKNLRDSVNNDSNYISDKFSVFSCSDILQTIPYFR